MNLFSVLAFDFSALGNARRISQQAADQLSIIFVLIYRGVRMNEYYLEKSGGLGDIFWSYYYHDQRFDRAYCNLLKKIKNLEPDCRITYVSCTSNSQVRQFYENNPFIDNLVVLPMSSWTNGSWVEHIQNKKCILNIDGVFYGENKGPVD